MEIGRKGFQPFTDRYLAVTQQSCYQPQSSSLDFAGAERRNETPQEGWAIAKLRFPRESRARGARSSLQNPVQTQAFRDLQPQGLQGSFVLAHRTSDASKDQLLGVGRLQLDVAIGDLA